MSLALPTCPAIRLPLVLCGGILTAIYCLGIHFAEAKEPAEVARVAELIGQLDDDLYDTRERAQQQLVEIGLPALEAVAEEARAGSLESSTRALNILLSWSESSDHSLQVAALEAIVTLPNRPREVSLANEVLADARERAALEAIVELGGFHNLDQPIQAHPNSRQRLPTQVVIGPNWRGDVEGLKHLAYLRNVMTASFHGAPIDESSLQVLEEMSNFRRLEFYGTNVSEEVSNALKEKLRPRGTDVDWRQTSARLGIVGDPAGTGRIQDVIVDSGADKAGLQVDDVITKLDGQPIKDFKTLTKRISQHQPGESVELTIIRHQHVEKAKVTFDKWGEGMAVLRGTDPGDKQLNPPESPQIQLNRR